MIFFSEHGLTVDSEGIRYREHNFHWPKVSSYGCRDQGVFCVININTHPIFTTNKETGSKIVAAIGTALETHRRSSV